MTLISHKYRYIFIHIPKTAGSSIQTALVSRERWPLLIRLIWRFFITFKIDKQTVLLSWINIHHIRGFFVAAFAAHATAREVKDALPGAIFDGYFKFAVVRNPWDHCVSVYEYFNQVHGRCYEFKEFLERGFTPQKARISDANGNLLVDYVARMENLESDMQHVFEKCGIPLAARDIIKSNQSSRQPLEDYYDAEAVEMVRRLYKDDIEYFGYSFPGNMPANGNASDTSDMKRA
jgi:hypothetical protein